MNTNDILSDLEKGNDISKNDILFFLNEVYTKNIDLEDIKHFLQLLAEKGETEEEILATVNYIKNNAFSIGPYRDALDIHGTGGDGSNSFNISTTTIFVLSAAGAIIAKHGNRSSSSLSGSADVLEVLGANIRLKPKQVEKCIEKVGIGFMFAQIFHPKLKQISRARKELGIKTIFNKAFPLVSPAGVQNHFIGLSNKELAPLYCQLLIKTGCENFMLAHGDDPLDEVSISSNTKIWQYQNRELKEYQIIPNKLGLPKGTIFDIKGGDPNNNAQITKGILSNKILGHKRNIVLLNSAASLLISNKVKEWKEGLELADKLISSGKALIKLEQFINVTNEV